MIKTREIESLSKEIAPIVAKASKLTISDGKGLKLATEALSEINRYSDSVEAKKESITKPMNEALRETRKLFKPLEEKLEGAISAIRQAMTSYQTEQVRIEREKQEKIAARVEKGTLKLDTAVRKLSEMEVVPTEVLSDSGLVKFREVKKYRITNEASIPRAYLMPDEAKIKEAMKQGIAIEGVEYYSEQLPINFR